MQSHLFSALENASATFLHLMHSVLQMKNEKQNRFQLIPSKIVVLVSKTMLECECDIFFLVARGKKPQKIQLQTHSEFMGF